MTEKKRVRRGKAQVRTPAQEKQELQITPSVEESARAAWHVDAPPDFRGLIDAERWD